ncbi:helix-turn-helix domain-containing protein [Streptomyces sp. NPDC059862]|uniref:helix-turn-helix domain-containing protein n=1 Tax=unclassified Streptomyces TaxID=2593676 RepID=UPI003628341B
MTAGGATADDISRRTGVDGAGSTRVLESLVRQGLACHTDGTPRVFRAVPPDVALIPHQAHRRRTGHGTGGGGPAAGDVPGDRAPPRRGAVAGGHHRGGGSASVAETDPGQRP